MSRHKVKRPSGNVRPAGVDCGPGRRAVDRGAILLAGKGSETDYKAKVKGQPAIVVDQQEYDYGEVKLGSSIKTAVKVTNVGDEPLRFSGRPYVELVEGC